MTTHVCSKAAVREAPDRATFLRRLRRWMNRATSEERYLAAASDHADLERRMRAVERAGRGPALVTSDH